MTRKRDVDYVEMFDEEIEIIDEYLKNIDEEVILGREPKAVNKAEANHIPNKLYKQILENVVNLCVDVCLRYNDGVLLVKRTEEPVKGSWWPVGGRIHKGETVDQAARRKIKEEIGIDFVGDLIPVGFYEDQYTANSFSDNTHYHTLSIVLAGDLDHDNPMFKLDKTSEEINYFKSLPERFKVKTFSQL